MFIWNSRRDSTSGIYLQPKLKLVANFPNLWSSCLTTSWIYQKKTKNSCNTVTTSIWTLYRRSVGLDVRRCTITSLKLRRSIGKHSTHRSRWGGEVWAIGWEKTQPAVIQTFSTWKGWEWVLVPGTLCRDAPRGLRDWSMNERRSTRLCNWAKGLMLKRADGLISNLQ